MDNTQQQTVSNRELLPLARQALADSPVYIGHISGLMAQCVDQLRAGDDRSAMSSFARGTSDLSNFIQLVDHVVTIAKSPSAKETDVFRAELNACVREMESSLIVHDYVALSDQIESRLLTLLSDWKKVEDELIASIEEQAS